MIDYIKRIVKEYTKGKPCALMLDSYGAHITSDIYKLAEKYKIELIVVPCCMTSTLAPLDVGNIYPCFFFRYHHYSSSSFFFLPLFLFPFFASLSLAGLLRFARDGNEARPFILNLSFSLSLSLLF
jgi:hypothetical protein